MLYIVTHSVITMTATELLMCCAAIAAPTLQLKDPIWEVQDEFMPVNRVEAAMWMHKQVRLLAE